METLYPKNAAISSDICNIDLVILQILSFAASNSMLKMHKNHGVKIMTASDYINHNILWLTIK